MKSKQKSTDGSYRLTLNIKPDEFKMLEELAEDLDRSLSWVAQRGIKEMHARHFNKNA